MMNFGGEERALFKHVIDSSLFRIMNSFMLKSLRIKYFLKTFFVPFYIEIQHFCEQVLEGTCTRIDLKDEQSF